MHLTRACLGWAAPDVEMYLSCDFTDNNVSYLLHLKMYSVGVCVVGVAVIGMSTRRGSSGMCILMYEICPACAHFSTHLQCFL